MNDVEVLNGDCAELLKDYVGQVDLIVTSPPYDTLREYGGYAGAFDFDKVADAIVPALSEGGIVCWVVWDKVIDGVYSLTSFRQAIDFDARGLGMHQPVVFHKSGASTLTSQNRLTTDIEWVFVMKRKGEKPRAFNPPIDKINRWHGFSAWAEGKRRGGSDALNRANNRKVIPKLSKRGSVWTYSIGHSLMEGGYMRAHEHPAIFPYQLASDLIKVYSNEGDLVVDPMCGSGTTLQAAKFLKRRAIGMDVNPDYCELSRDRVAQDLLV